MPKEASPKGALCLWVHRVGCIGMGEDLGGVKRKNMIKGVCDFFLIL